MKEWIRNLGFEEIGTLAKRAGELEDLPADVDERIASLIIGRCRVKPEKTRIFGMPLWGFSLAAAAALALVCIPVAYFAIADKAIPASVVMVSGNAHLDRAGVTLKARTSDLPVSGDAFSTGQGSLGVLALGPDYLVRMSESAKMRIESLGERSIRVYLESGEIKVLFLGNNASPTPFIVRTANYTARATGTVAVFGSFPLEGSISAVKGTVYVERGFGTYSQVSEGMAVSYEEKGLVDIRMLTNEEEQAVPMNTGLYASAGDDKGASLSITSETPEALLVLGGKPVEMFDGEIMLRIRAGKHSIVIEKPGHLSFEKEIELAPSAEYSLHVPALAPESGNIRQSRDLDKTALTLVSSARVYRLSSNGEPSRNEIRGFFSDGDNLIAYSRDSVLSINKSGSLLWRRDYGEKQRLLIDSVPVIARGKVFIASNYAIIVVDAKTGRELKRIAAPGILGYGYTIALDGGRGLVPYPEGIYSLDFAQERVSRDPVIAFLNSTTPLVTETGVYATSFVRNELVRFSHDGKIEGTLSLEGICVAPPVLLKDFIFAGDMTGALYRADKQFKDAVSTGLGTGIISVTPGKSFLVAQTEDGKIHSIDPVSLGFKSAVIETGGGNNRRKPAIIGKNIIAGTNSGYVRVLDAYTCSLTGSMKISESPVSCSIADFGGVLFAGCKDGEVIRIIYE